MNRPIRLALLRATMMAGAVMAFPPATGALVAATPAASGCEAAEYHQLDFWIGDWDTFETEDLDGPAIARARVNPIAGGCAIHELYEQADGLIGDSILSYDPVRKQWQQTWVTNRGSLMVLVGGFTGSSLVLEGETHQQDGTSVMQRITWEVHPHGVREWAVMSTDNGATWTAAFDVLFRKRENKQ